MNTTASDVTLWSSSVSKRGFSVVSPKWDEHLSLTLGGKHRHKVWTDKWGDVEGNILTWRLMKAIQTSEGLFIWRNLLFDLFQSRYLCFRSQILLKTPLLLHSPAPCTGDFQAKRLWHPFIYNIIQQTFSITHHKHTTTCLYNRSINDRFF